MCISYLLLLQDDPDSPDYNVPDRVDAFISVCNHWSSKMRGNDILFMMGSDFTYANANAYFQNMDKLIHYVNRDGRVNVFYSTPGDYVEAKAGYKDVKWPVKTDDFFPYADCAHCYWTGNGRRAGPSPLWAAASASLGFRVRV